MLASSHRTACRSAQALALVLIGCSSGEAPTEQRTAVLEAERPHRDPVVATRVPPPSPTPSTATSTPALRLRTVDRASLQGVQRCGRFSSEALQRVSLLEGRLQMQFVRGGQVEGDENSQRFLVTREEASIFVGAYEMNMTRGPDFIAQAQARASNFSEVFDAVSLVGPGAMRSTAVFGVPHETVEQNGMVFLAHGTVARADDSLIDVAVVVSRSEVSDLEACTRFALSMLDTLEDGPRALPSPPSTPQEVEVSYAHFGFTLPPGWRVSEAYGIHDFARIHFVRGGVFPERSTTLQMALDSHPGDWATGAPSGTREGRLLGVPVTWSLSESEGMNASCVSTELVGRDHAVAAIHAPNAALREEAVLFAESVRLVARP